MSSSDSESIDSESSNDWPWECMHSDNEDLDSSMTDDYDDSLSEESSGEVPASDRKSVFISIYNNDNLDNTTIISNATEIKNYRKRYSQLSQKNVKNINNIWGDVKVHIPLLGHVSLKVYDDDLDEESKNKKKRYKKPNHAIQKKVLVDFDTSDSEQSDRNSCVSSQTGTRKLNTKVVPKSLKSNKKVEIQSQINVNNVNSNSIKSTNTTSQSTNKENKSENKNEIKKLEVTDKTAKPVGNDKNVKTNNNVKTDIMHKYIKTNLTNTPVKANPTNPPVKTNQINTPIKTNLTNTPVKTKLKNTPVNANITNTSIKSNSVEKSTIQNTGNTPIKLNDVDKTEKHNLNANKNIKSDITEPIFKKPSVVKNIKSSLCNAAQNKAVDQNIKSDEQSSKKRLKKQKQKEKKLGTKRDSSNSSSKEVSESSIKTLTKNKKSVSKENNIKIEAEKLDKKQNETFVNKKSEKNTKIEIEKSNEDSDADQTEEMNTSNDNMDLLTDTENMPTFIAELVKRKEKKNKTTKIKQLADPVSKNMEKKVNSKNDTKQEFVIHTRKREKAMAVSNENYSFYSEKFGEEAVDMILENNLIGGLEYVSEALSFNPSDHRHYLNRCFCYLRMNRPALALTDAQYVIQTSTNIGHVFIANLRAGQASFALQRYQQAETYLKEAIRINPENLHAMRELMRVKIARIVNMGFKEKDALLALEIYPCITEAINYLTENNSYSNDSEFANNFELPYDSYDDTVYSSDADEEYTNVEILNRILNYKPGKVKLHHVVAKSLNPGLLVSTTSDKNASTKNTADAKKKIVLNGKTFSGQVKEKAIWVGNLTNRITEAMLKQKFKQFGNVISVYRPLNESYAFVNFEKSEAVTNALINTSCHEIAGIKLAVRSAVRQK